MQLTGAGIPVPADVAVAAGERQCLGGESDGAEDPVAGADEVPRLGADMYGGALGALGGDQLVADLAGGWVQRKIEMRFGDPLDAVRNMDRGRVGSAEAAAVGRRRQMDQVAGLKSA